MPQSAMLSQKGEKDRYTAFKTDQDGRPARLQRWGRLGLHFEGRETRPPGTAQKHPPPAPIDRSTRHPRRALRLEGIARLLAVAPEWRRLLYSTVLLSGLRLSEPQAMSRDNLGETMGEKVLSSTNCAMSVLRVPEDDGQAERKLLSENSLSDAEDSRGLCRGDTGPTARPDRRSMRKASLPTAREPPPASLSPNRSSPTD